jgi:hypothetical protein
MSAFEDVFKAAAEKVAGSRIGSPEDVQKRALGSGGDVLKGTVNGYGQNPNVPGAGDHTYGSQQGGRDLGSAYAEGPTGGGQLDNQAQRPGPWSSVDTEASRSHGPGTANSAADLPVTGGFARSLQQPQAGLGKAPLHIYGNAQCRMVAGQLVRNTITEFGAGPDGQPIAVERYGPTVQVAQYDLNPYVWAGVMAKVNSLTSTFRSLCGRYPAVGSHDFIDPLIA